MIQGITKFIARNRASKWMQKLDRGLLRIHRAYENVNYDIGTNGELDVIRKLARTGRVSAVFDVGANRGDWTDLAALEFPSAQIHSFEIVPETSGHLIKRFGNSPNIRINNMGLSDAEGTLNVFFDADRDELATCVTGFSEAFHRYNPETRTANVTTGDRYCSEHGVDAIGLLKVDVEGFEPQVLRGFQGMLQGGQIDAIQFEYGYINIDTHFLLKDFYDYLSPFDMAIGKIYPTYVDFRPYRHIDEDFYGPNFLAVRRERQDLLQLLGRR